MSNLSRDVRSMDFSLFYFVDFALDKVQVNALIQDVIETWLAFQETESDEVEVKEKCYGC